MINISKNFKSFLTDSFIYTIVNLINKAIPFVLLPVLVRLVTPLEFGIYSLFITIETLLMPITTLNTHASLSSHYYVEDIDKVKYLSTLILFWLVNCLFFILISNFIPMDLESSIGISNRLFTLAILTSSFGGLSALVSNLFRLQRKPWQYGIFIALQSLMLLCFVIVFVYAFGKNSFILIIGRSFSFFIFSIFTIILLWNRKLIAFVIDISYLFRILKFSIPTVLFSLSAFVFSSSDKFFIQHYLGLKEVGIYSAINQIAAVISILGMSFSAAWIPWLFENLNKNELKTNSFIVKLSYYLMIAFIVSGFIFAFIFHFFSSYILTNDYIPYIKVGIPTIFGFVFQSLYFVISPYIYYKEKTLFLAYGGIGVAIINVILNILLIPYIGILGASYSTFISWFLLFVYSFYISNKIYPMPWNFKNIKT